MSIYFSDQFRKEQGYGTERESDKTKQAGAGETQLSRRS